MKNAGDFNLDFDEQLYKKLKEGNETTFAFVFNRHHKAFYALAYRYLKSGTEAEDAVQHTFMRLWEQRKSLHISTNLRSLLFTILKNYILNELRHRRIVFEKHYELAQKDEETAEDIMKALENNELRNHLRAAINELPVRKRKICLLKIEEGLSNQEIADKLQITVPTVKSHYTQAIKQLRLHIDKLLLILLLC